jgi:hypothetical protein
MGKRIVLDLSWLIGYKLRPSHLSTIISQSYTSHYGTCYLHASRHNMVCESDILYLFDITFVETSGLCNYTFEISLITSRGLRIILGIGYTFKTITTISDIVDFVLGGTCYRFYPKRNDKYEVLKIDKPETIFNIENLWK